MILWYCDIVTLNGGHRVARKICFFETRLLLNVCIRKSSRCVLVVVMSPLPSPSSYWSLSTSECLRLAFCSIALNITWTNGTLHCTPYIVHPTSYTLHRAKHNLNKWHPTLCVTNFYRFLFSSVSQNPRRSIQLSNVDCEIPFRNGHDLISSYLKLIATVTGDWTSEGDAGVYIRTRLFPRRANSP